MFNICLHLTFFFLILHNCISFVKLHRCVLPQKYKMFLLFPKHDSHKIRRLNPLTDPEKKSISFQALLAENFKGVRK